MTPDVAQGRRAQHGVGDGVQEHVGVGVPVQPLFKRNLDPAQNEGAALHQAVRIVALAHADRHHGGISQNQTGDALIARMGHLQIGGATRHHLDREP